MKKVLLTDALQRKVLSAARSLGSKGIVVYTAEKTHFTPAAFSKYCNRSFVSPCPQKEPDKYYSWLKETILKEGCDVFFPMDDDTLDIAMRYREELEKICRVPLPPTASYILAADKGSAVLKASEAGLLCPKTALVSDITEAVELADNLEYPVVIKPRRSSGSRGIRIARDKRSFIEQYMLVHKTYPLPIVQEYINTGPRYDVCLLYDRNSCLKASFVQKEVRHFPVELGPSTVQESIYHQELLEMAITLMKGIPWYGVVEIEFMESKDDKRLRFMEINPRFWGSLQMAVLAGVDFPWLLYRMINNEEIDEVFTYQTGLKCRWLLPGDILHYIFNKNRKDMDPPFFSHENVHDDILSWDDPMPAVGFLLSAIRYLGKKDMWKLMFFR